jgi:Ca-activated chloride channel family protein
MIEFGWPWFFYLLPLPLLAWLLPRANRQEAALKTPSFNRLKRLSAELEPQSSRMLWRSLVVLLWLALIIAGSQPKWVGDAITLPSSGRDLLLAVDISGSMGTEDMRLSGQMVTRLAAVKAVVGEFVERRRGDRLGLILFGSQAYLQAPLTFDRKTINTLLMETPLGIAGGKTAIGDAIGLSVKRLLDRPAANRVLILLTDGVNNVGEVSPIQAAKLAAQEGITIYTIGFGADEMEVSGLLFNRTVNPSAELDTETLTEIAGLTGGLYQRARSTAELASIYLALDELEPIEVEQETYRPEKSLFFWPLGGALVLSLFVAGFWLLRTALAERAFSSRDDAEVTP